MGILDFVMCVSTDPYSRGVLGATLSPYEDDSGQPILADSVVLFLDLLGTSGPRSDDEALVQLKRTREAVSAAQSISDPGRSADGSYRWFSDNLGLSHPVPSERAAASTLAQLVRQTAELQLELAAKRFASRGAIARGLYFVDQNFIHGPALERAVALEKSRAVFPRVVLDEQSITTARALVAPAAGEAGLLVDEHGVVFVDFLPAVLGTDPFGARPTLDQLREWIREQLWLSDGVPHVEEKYRWLATYFDYFVDLYETTLEEIDIDLSTFRIQPARPLGEFKPFVAPSVGLDRLRD